MVHAVGRVQTHDRVGGQPTAVHNFLQHGLAVGIDTPGLGTDDGIVQNGGKGPGQIPGLKERGPVDELGQLAQVEVFEYATANEFGYRWLVGSPVDRRLVGTRLFQRPQRRLLLVGVLVAHLVVVLVQLVNELRRTVTEQALRHAHAARGIGHIGHRALVMRGDAHGGVHAAGGRAADQQRNLLEAEVVVLLHLAGHILHLFQAGRDQARQTNDVGPLRLGAGQHLMARHHDAHVDHVEVVALQDHGDDVLANVMHIALDGSDDDLAFALDVTAGRFVQALFLFNVGNQVRNGLLHHARTLDHLGQEHLALAEQVTHDVHAVHQRAFDDV